MRPAAQTPRLTAGLMWQPEMGPIPYAAPIRAKPKAIAMPRMPTLSPATTAVPQPKNTRMKVPTSSAKYFFMIPPKAASSYLLLAPSCWHQRAGLRDEQKLCRGGIRARSSRWLVRSECVRGHSVASRDELEAKIRFQIHQTFANCLPCCISLLTIPGGPKHLQTRGNPRRPPEKGNSVEPNRISA